MEIKVDAKNRQKIIDAGLEYQQTFMKSLAEIEKAYREKNDADIKDAMKRDFRNLWLGRSYEEAKKFLQIGERFKDSLYHIDYNIRMSRINAIDNILDRITKFDEVILNKDDINALGL